MGGKPKTVYVPQASTPAASTPEGQAAAAAAAAYVPPASQQSPTAASGETAKGAGAMAAGLGFGGTVLTSGAGLTQQASTTRSKALLGA
jgi:hypothetical protein